MIPPARRTWPSVHLRLVAPGSPFVPDRGDNLYELVVVCIFIVSKMVILTIFLFRPQLLHFHRQQPPWPNWWSPVPRTFWSTLFSLFGLILTWVDCWFCISVEIDHDVSNFESASFWLQPSSLASTASSCCRERNAPSTPLTIPPLQWQCRPCSPMPSTEWLAARVVYEPWPSLAAHLHLCLVSPPSLVTPSPHPSPLLPKRGNN